MFNTDRLVQYDFSGLGPWLFGGLVALRMCHTSYLDTEINPRSAVMTGIVGIFIPFSNTMDIVYACGGCLIFSGYIVYDTYMINKRLSPDEFIMASISLYLE
jgi:FtsH-binding integral membrane protein